MERNVKVSYSGINKSKIFKAVQSVLLKDIGIGPVRKMFSNGVNLIFVSRRKMAELNKKYRGKTKPSNILSFGFGDPALERNRLGRMKFISFKGGDIVLCSEVTAEEAKKYGFTQKNWMTRLIVHGILHLAGYDHVRQKDEFEMEQLEKMILDKLDIKEI